MIADLIALDEEISRCRSRAQDDCKSECHEITKFYSHGGQRPMLTVPWPQYLKGPIEVMTVGINPRWTKKEDIESESNPIGQLNGPSTFDAYKNTILADIPKNAIAHVELVQCGTPSGNEISGVIALCKSRFFDKVVEELKPRVIIPIGDMPPNTFIGITLMMGNPANLGTEYVIGTQPSNTLIFQAISVF